MQYGIKETTKITDHTTYHAGEPIIKKSYYEVKYRTDKIDVQAIANLAKELLDDPAKLDVGFKLEKTKNGEANGYFNLVACYTMLEY